MSRLPTTVIVLAIAVLVGTPRAKVEASKSPMQKQEKVTPQEASTLSLNEGRFQVVHIYYSTAQQGTGLVDTQTGRVWLMEVSTDKDGRQSWSFYQVLVPYRELLIPVR